MTTARTFTALVVATVLGAALGCRKGHPEADTVDAEIAAREGAMGMRSLATPVDTIALVEAHLQRLATNDGDSLRIVVPVDSQVVAMLIVHCEAMMRSMNMARPANWATTVTMLREDATRMRSMSPAQLTSFVPAHRRRVEALLEMHRTMPGR